MNQGPQFQSVVPLTRAVKGLIIANVASWIILVLILEKMILQNNVIFEWFALVPARVITQFWVWQLVTYMFLHATSPFHILFNMLVLWWFGAELEMRWGPKAFVIYYLVCGAGAGAIYLLGTLSYYLVTGKVLAMAAPLIGASGATYGLLLAYGMLFGDRIIYFMMLFPMRARYFVMVMGGVELVTMMDGGSGSQVSNLAHLGGIAAGYLYLTFQGRWRARVSTLSAKRGRRLKLVVDNEKSEKKTSDQGPKYWN